MAFLYSFSAPRTRPLQFESLAQTSLGSSLLNAVGSFFGGGGSSGGSKAPNAAAAAAAAGSNNAAASSSAATAAAAVPPPQPDLTASLVPASAPTNLALATLARTRVLVAQSTPQSIDREADLTRAQALREYLPFICTLHAQEAEVTDPAEKARIAKSGVLQWSSVLQVGARPNAKDEVPYFNYGALDLGEELAHAYFSLAIALYQRAGALSFHAEQLANTIPPCNYLNMLDWYAAESAAAAGGAVDDAAAPPKRMFNPLSYIAPPSAAAAGGPPAPSPKSASEVASIRASIISKRKEAVECLRRAAGLFHFLAQEFLPSLPIPSTVGRRMLDTMPALSEALGDLCLVHCQQHTLLSAMLALGGGGGDAHAASPQKPLSPTIVAKLLQGIVDKLAAVRQTLQHHTGSYYLSIEPAFLLWIRVTLRATAANRLLVLGIQAEQAGDHGRALALIAAAQAGLTSLVGTDASAGGLANLQQVRDCNPVLTEMKQAVMLQLIQVKKVYERLEKDNTRIYFEKVPGLEEALVAMGDPPGAATAEPGSLAGDDAPPSVFLPTPLPYQPPPTLQALFINTPFAAKWTAAAAAAAPPAEVA